MDTEKDLTDLPMLDERDALMAKEGELVAVELEAAAVPAVNNDALLDVKEDESWDFEEAIGISEVERVGVKRKLCELQEKCCAKLRKVLTSVAKVFTLPKELLRSVGAHMSIAKRASCVSRGEELGVKPETMTDKWAGSCKALAEFIAEHD